MACYTPLPAYKLGGQIHLGSKGASKVAEAVQLPCGKCPGCMAERSRQWAARMISEASQHETCCFITLTYDNDNLPMPPSLDHRHFQLFMKRLRKMLHPLRIRYFMAGEYGTRNRRPHYHAIIFGWDFPDKTRTPGSTGGNPLFNSQSLGQLWPYGFHTIGEFNYATAQYCAKYCVKDSESELSPNQWTDFETGEVFDITPEYHKMSTHPGIGYAWFLKYKDDVFKNHDYMVVNGFKTRPPKYFDRLLKRIDPERYDQVKAARVDRAKLRADDNTPARLRAKALIAKSKRALFNKPREGQ